MKYLLDANTYIQAKNFYYGMDICPAYWDWLDHQFQLGLVASVQMIGKELKDGHDELASWAKARPEHFIDNDDTDTQSVFSEIVQSVAAGDVRAYAVDALETMKAREQAAMIVERLKDGASIVSIPAMKALGVLGAKEHLPRVIERIRDRDPVLQAEAIKVLGLLKVKEQVGRIGCHQEQVSLLIKQSARWNSARIKIPR